MMTLLISLIASLSLFSPPSWANLNGHFLPNPGRVCLNSLSRITPDFSQATRIHSNSALADIFSRCTIESLDDNGNAGFLLRAPGSRQKKNVRTILVPPNQWSPPFSVRTRWIFERNEYDFLDTGFKRFESYSMYLHRFIRNQLILFPGEDLEIRYDPIRVEAERISDIDRWNIHRAVLEKYKERKGYLTGKDFWILTALNRLSSNNDVFGLYKHDPKITSSSSTMNPNDLLTAIQITYFGDRDYFNPNIREFRRALDLQIDESEDRFPFAYRLGKTQETKDFLRRFYSRFPPPETCEVVRYARFANVPSAISDRIIYNVFKRIIDTGMKHVVIGVDDFTGPFFSAKYKFKLYERLPMPEKSGLERRTNEFLYYLDVETPRFQKVFAKLENAARAVWVPGEGDYDY